MFTEKNLKLIPVAVHSKEYTCGLSFAGIEGSNPTADMEVRLLKILCVGRVEAFAMSR